MKLASRERLPQQGCRGLATLGVGPGAVAQPTLRPPPSKASPPPRPACAISAQAGGWGEDGAAALPQKGMETAAEAKVAQVQQLRSEVSALRQELGIEPGP